MLLLNQTRKILAVTTMMIVAATTKLIRKTFLSKGKSQTSVSLVSVVKAMMMKRRKVVMTVVMPIVANANKQVHEVSVFLKRSYLQSNKNKTKIGNCGCCQTSDCCGSSSSSKEEDSCCKKGCCGVADSPTPTPTPKAEPGCKDACCGDVSDDEAENVHDKHDGNGVGDDDDDDDIDKTTTTMMSVVGMTCTDCATSAERLLGKLNGVVKVDASFSASRIVVNHTASVVSAMQLIDRLAKLNFTATVISSSKSSSSSSASASSPSSIIDKDADKRLIVSLTHGATTTDVQDTIARMSALKCIERVQFDASTSVSSTTATVYVRDGFKRRNAIDALAAASLPHALFDATAAAAVSNEAIEQKELRKWLVHVIVSTLIAIPLALITFAFPDRIEPLVRLSVGFVLCSIVQLFTGAPLYVSAYAALRYTGRPNVDCLVMLSTTTAYIYGSIVYFIWLSAITTTTTSVAVLPPPEVFFETPPILLALIVIGRYLEKRAKRRTGDALRAIRSLQTSTAKLLNNTNNADDNDTTRTIDCSLIDVGDLLRVEPGASVPVDGVVVRGSTTVDESMVTGESRPQVHRIYLEL